MGYHKPVDPKDVWGYSTRKLTSAENIINYERTVLSCSQREIIPEGVYFIVVGSVYGGTATASLQFKDIYGEWRDAKSYELSQHEGAIVGVVMSDGSNIAINCNPSGSIRAYLFKVKIL